MLKHIDIFKKASKIGNIALSIVIVLCIISTVYARVSYSNGSIPNIFGYTPTVVVSGSMLPSIQINSLNIIHNTPYDDIALGDIIVYRDESRDINILHRVIDITTDNYGNKAFITKGDANSMPDNIYVTKDLYEGEVVKTLNWLAPFLDSVIKNGSISYINLLKIGILVSLAIWICVAAVSSIGNIIFNFIKLNINKYFNKTSEVDENGIQKQKRKTNSDSGHKQK